jgi:hypothetical protein
MTGAFAIGIVLSVAVAIFARVVGMSAFVACAVIGFRKSMWLVYDVGAAACLGWISRR